MVPPGQLCVSACSSAWLSKKKSLPPVFVPFCPSFFIILSFPFVPFSASVCHLRFAFFAFCWLFFFLLVRLIFSFDFCVLISFCFPGVLSGGVHMLVFCFLPLFYTPRDACEPEICEKLRILLCVLSWFLALYCFLAWLELFSLSSLLDVWFFSIFDFDFSTSSCYFHPVYFFWV